MKKEYYAAFISKMIALHKLEEKASEIVIFADNASVHHANYIKKCLGNKVTFFYNATYSPMLNPIEEFFSKFKGFILKQSCQNIQELYHAIVNSLRRFNNDDFKGYIRHTLKFVQKALANEDL